jgi:hypothetical protein
MELWSSGTHWVDGSADLAHRLFQKIPNMVQFVYVIPKYPCSNRLWVAGLRFSHPTIIARGLALLQCYCSLPVAVKFAYILLFRLNYCFQ